MASISRNENFFFFFLIYSWLNPQNSWEEDQPCVCGCACTPTCTHTHVRSHTHTPMQRLPAMTSFFPTHQPPSSLQLLQRTGVAGWVLLTRATAPSMPLVCSEPRGQQGGSLPRAPVSVAWWRAVSGCAVLQTARDSSGRRRLPVWQGSCVPRAVSGNEARAHSFPFLQFRQLGRRAWAPESDRSRYKSQVCYFPAV